MRQGSERKFRFAGENVIQESPKEFNATSPVFGPSVTKGNVDESLDLSHFSRSIQIRDPEVEPFEFKGRLSARKRSEPARATPARDLGENFVRVLLDEFKRMKGVGTKDPKVLLEFWKQNKKNRQKDEEKLNRSGMDKSFLSHASQASERVRELQAIAKEREEDVVLTLEVHAEILKQEENIKNFMLDAYRRRKAEERENAKKKKKMTKETLDRLYKAPPPKEEKKEKETGLSEGYDKEFVTRLMKRFQEDRPSEVRYAHSDLVFKFWENIKDKDEAKLKKNEKVVQMDLDKYFDKRYEIIQSMYVYKYGYRSFDHKLLLNFYNTEIPEATRVKRNIDFESSALEKPLEVHLAKHKKEWEEHEAKVREENRVKEEEERKKLSKITIKKEIKATKLDKLAKPKDNLQKGKTIMLLRKLFPNDKILQRMLFNEFRENKLSKYPEEYDNYDSDEEIEIHRRDEVKEPFKTIKREGRALKISDLYKPMMAREKDIVEPFHQYLNDKYLQNNLKLETEKERIEREKKEDKQINRFIAIRVREFLKMRKKRLEGKIQTLSEFLVYTYKEMKKAYRRATIRRFPHITYGYSKRLKKNSYPFEFKKYFFFLVRAASRGNKISEGKKLLPFWAPPSAGERPYHNLSAKQGLRSYHTLSTNQSYNRRINELSRDTKLAKIEADRDKVSIWQKDEYFNTRLDIMMKFSDAKECTFTPSVGSKMPNSYKKLMLEFYGSWAPQHLSRTKESFDVMPFKYLEYLIC